MTSSDRVKLAAEAGTYSLTITGVKTTDEGQYTCNASNQAGSLSTAANLKIESKLFPVIKGVIQSAV